MTLCMLVTLQPGEEMKFSEVESCLAEAALKRPGLQSYCISWVECSASLCFCDSVAPTNLHCETPPTSTIGQSEQRITNKRKKTANRSLGLILLETAFLSSCMDNNQDQEKCLMLCVTVLQNVCLLGDKERQKKKWSIHFFATAGRPFHAQGPFYPYGRSRFVVWCLPLNSKLCNCWKVNKKKVKTKTKWNKRD